MELILWLNLSMLQKNSMILKSRLIHRKKFVKSLMMYEDAEYVTKNGTEYGFPCLYLSSLSDKILCDKPYF